MRILLVGNPGVGKSAILRRLFDLPFIPIYTPTGFYAKYCIAPSVEVIEMPGSDLYRSFATNAFADVDRIVVVVSLTDPRSVQSYAAWIRKFEHLGKPFVVLVNKADINPATRTAAEALHALDPATEKWVYVSAHLDSSERLIHELTL